MCVTLAVVTITSTTSSVLTRSTCVNSPVCFRLTEVFCFNVTCYPTNATTGTSLSSRTTMNRATPRRNSGRRRQQLAFPLNLLKVCTSFATSRITVETF